MISGQRRSSIRFLPLLLLWPISHVYADGNGDLSLGKSSDEWKSVLTNGKGKSACELKDWMQSSQCTPPGDSGANTGRGGSSRLDVGGTGRGDSDDGGRDGQIRRALNSDDNQTPPTSSCTCTPQFFNIYCGCLLTNGSNLDTVNYTDWTITCEQNGLSLTNSTSWLNALGQDLPKWAFVQLNGQSFNSQVVWDLASKSKKWTTIQILTPIIVGVSSIVLVTLIFICWQRQCHRSRPKFDKPFLVTYVQKRFKGRTRSIRHEDRNNEWSIDGEHVVNDNESDTESFFMVSHPHSVVESPVEVSYWSPTTASFSSPPLQPRQYSFKPKRPSRLGVVEERMLGVSTMRSIGDRMKNLMPWVSRPTPVRNIRPGSRYRIDGDRSTIGGKSRSNTSSTFSTRVGGRYATISEEADEAADTVGIGRTRNAGGIKNGRADREITQEDRDAVAGSVILIGDDFPTLESGSTGAHGTPSKPMAGTAANVKGRQVSLGNLKSPSINVNFQVEPPSPTLESLAVPSPGAPPLLPPPPQERPPLPPAITRTTPRRTPSPHLRVDTQVDDGSSYPSSRRQSGSNLSNNTNVGSNYMHPALRPSTSNSNLQPPIERGHPYQSPQRDRPGSSSGTSTDVKTNTNANALSYASLPGPGPGPPGPHRHSPSTSNIPINENNYLANNADSSSSRRRSGSDTRPLPHHRPTGGLAPGPLELKNQKSETSIGDYSILRAPQGDGRRLSSSGDTSQGSEFDPYKAQGIPRPYSYQTHQRSASSQGLLRAPGEAMGADGGEVVHHTRGWSLDDDADRASLLMNREPMGVDDGMGFGSGGGSVYLATPRDGNIGRHSRNQSSESFMSANSDFGTGERVRGGRGGSWEGGGGATGGRSSSPTLSMLEADPRNRSGAFASYAGRESISGSSGWDASTQAHGGNISPIDLPPVPALRDPDDFSPGSNGSFTSSPSLTPNRNLTPSASPRVGGHVRLGSTEVLKPSRSREDILVPARNDPVRLFPDSVRGAGYMTGLGPDAVPVPSRTPRPNGNGNGNGSGNDDSNANANANGSGRTTGNSIERSVSSGVGLTGSGVFAGYVGRDSTQAGVGGGSGGGTWGTDSSGVQTIFEAVQQLPDVYMPPHTGPGPSSSSRRTSS